MSTPPCHNCSGALGGLDVYWSYLCLKPLPFWAGFRAFPSLQMDPGINWGYSRIRRTVEPKSIILWRPWATMRAYEAYMATLGLQGTGPKGVILPLRNFTQARANKPSAVEMASFIYSLRTFSPTPVVEASYHYSWSSYLIYKFMRFLLPWSCLASEKYLRFYRLGLSMSFRQWPLLLNKG